MTYHKFFLSIIALGFTIITTSAQDVKSKTESISYANELLEKAIQKKKSIGVVAGVSVDGSIIWSNAAGFEDAKSKTPLHVDAPMRIASIVKPMTAVAIFQLVEAGQLDLDVPIQNYLPTYPKKKKGAITTRQLLSHSSGIGAYESGKERENKTHYESLQEALGIFQLRELKSIPGTSFGYTSYGYVVLGRIIEEISQMSYEDYMIKNVFEPAGMTNTATESEEYMRNSMPPLYHKKGNGKIKSAKSTDISDRIPAGGFRSTVSDLLKFGDALIANTLISRESFELMIKDTGLKKEGNPYGFGLYLYGVNPDLGNVVGHTGGQLGCSSFMMILPESNAVVVTNSNTSGAGQEVSNITVGLFQVVKAYKE